MNKHLKRIIAICKIHRMKRKADKYREEAIRNGVKEKNARHFIVMFNGVPVILSKADFKQARQKGLFKQDITAEQLNKIAIYKTK